MLLQIVETVTKERLTELLAEGLSSAEIAQALGVWPRTVERAKIRHGLREKTPPWNLGEDELQRMEVLAADGLPPSWIAEDIGRSAHTVGKKLGPQPERNQEWRRVWQQIRRNPELLELHREIAPKPKSMKGVAA